MAFKRVNNRSMTDLIWDHLRNAGSISQLEAAGLYRVRSLTRRIADLRERYGHDAIRSAWHTDNTGQRYTRYYFNGGTENAS